MKKKFAVLILPVLVVMCLFSLRSANAEIKAELWIEAPGGIVHQGDTIQVSVKMRLTDAVANTYDFAVLYDNTLLKYKRCTEVYRPVAVDENGEIVYATAESNINVTDSEIQFLFVSHPDYLDSTSVPKGETILAVMEFEVVKTNIIDDVIKTSLVIGKTLSVGYMDGGRLYAIKNIVYNGADVNIASPLSADADLKSVTLSSGTLTPVFAPDVTQYRIVVDNLIDKITINGITNSTKASASVIKDAALAVGENRFTITVTAEKGNTKTYTFIVERKKSSDATLSTLKGSAGVWDSAFSPDKFVYNVTVPYHVSWFTLRYDVNHSMANAEMIGVSTDKISVGTNVFKIRVTAEDGTQNVYTVNVIRQAPSKDATLSTIKVDGSLLDGFSSDKTEYTLNVPYEKDKIKLEVKTSDPRAVSDTVVEKTLEEGDNKIKIIVTAEDGETQNTYVVNVIRAHASTNADLKEITLNGTKLEGFAADTVAYNITVENSVQTMAIAALAADNKAVSVVIDGEQSLKVEEVNVFKITVTAQDNKTKKVYTVNVTRNGSSDNTLKSLVPSAGSLTPQFSPNVTDYAVSLPYETEKISFNAIANNEYAKVVAATDIAVEAGKTKTIEIVVTAQDGSKKTYAIKVTRAAPSNDNTLKSLAPSAGSLTPQFSPNITDYVISLPYEIEKISFSAIANDKYASVAVATDIAVETGKTKTVEIVVTAQDGSKKTYTVNVTRAAASGDNTLKSISPSVGTLEPKFSPDITEYKISVGYNVELIHIPYTVNNANAKGMLIGSSQLKPGNNKFTIRVTAQNGEVKEYEITVEREMPSDDNTLKSLETSNGSLSPKFAPDVTEYKMNVPYSVTAIDFKFAVSDPTGSAVQINRNIDIGVTVIKIEVRAQSGALKTYNIAVTREAPETDSALKSLVPSAGTLNPVFEPTVYNYDITVGNSVDVIVFDCVLRGNKSRYEISGPETLVVGNENVYTITVIAEDGITKSYYLVNVNRLSVSSDSSLESLIVEGVDFTFNPDVKTYELKAPLSMTEAKISFKTSNEYAKAVIEGKSTLSKDEPNKFKITVTAQNGTTSVYTIIITLRDAETDSTLSNLKCNETDINFSPDVTEYNLTVPYSVEKVTFEYAAKNKHAKAALSGPEILEVGGKNVYTITVTAEDGSQTVYTVNVERSKKSSDTSIKNINTNNPLAILKFEADKKYYDMKVPYSVTGIEFTVELSSAYATAECSGPESLVAGVNSVYTITVTAEDGTKDSYTINVMREKMSSDNSLSKLTVSDGTLSPEFKPDVTEYNVSVPYSVSLIVIDYEANHIASSVRLEGNKVLNVGENLISVIVTAEDKTERTYNIKVTRLDKDSDSTLKSLTSNVADIKFDPDVKEYYIDVAYNIAAISFTYEANSKVATAVMTGNEELEVGKDNIFVIKVTAENGTTTDYKIVVNRRNKSSDSSVSMLKVNGKEITLVEGQTEYEASMIFSRDEITVEVKTSNEYALYDVVIPEEIIVGINPVTINVTAEDGSKTEYVVYVKKERASANAFIKELTPSKGQFDEAFNKNNFGYVLRLTDDAESVDFVIVTEHEGATYKIKGNTALKAGKNKVEIVVTSETGTSMTYIVEVLRGEEKKQSFFMRPVFKIGKFEVTGLLFLIVSGIIIAACSTVLFIIIKGNRNMKKYGRR